MISPIIPPPSSREHLLILWVSQTVRAQHLVGQTAVSTRAPSQEEGKRKAGLLAKSCGPGIRPYLPGKRDSFVRTEKSLHSLTELCSHGLHILGGAAFSFVHLEEMAFSNLHQDTVYPIIGLVRFPTLHMQLDFSLIRV